jgi:hypothetical protein
VIELAPYISIAITTLIGLIVRSWYQRVKDTPKKSDLQALEAKLNDDIDDFQLRFTENLEAIRTAVSGVTRALEDIRKEDIATETKQWTKIDTLAEKVGKLEGQMELIILKERGLNG